AASKRWLNCPTRDIATVGGRENESLFRQVVQIADLRTDTARCANSSETPTIAAGITKNHWLRLLQLRLTSAPRGGARAGSRRDSCYGSNRSSASPNIWCWWQVAGAA